MGGGGMKRGRWVVPEDDGGGRVPCGLLAVACQSVLPSTRCGGLHWRQNRGAAQGPLGFLGGQQGPGT